jgi:hypothetical protein
MLILMHYASKTEISGKPIEIRKLRAFEYFLTIKNVDTNIPGRTIKSLNWLLRITYVLYACSMIVAISKSIIDEFVK